MVVSYKKNLVKQNNYGRMIFAMNFVVTDNLTLKVKRRIPDLKQLFSMVWDWDFLAVFLKQYTMFEQ